MDSEEPPLIALVFNQDAETGFGDTQELIALQETEFTTHMIHDALESLGLRTVLIAARPPLADLRQQLESLPRQSTFIFNNCDGFAGENSGAAVVTRMFEEMGFRHTGAEADVIELCTHKERAKRRLLEHGIPTPRYQVMGSPEGDIRVPFPVIIKPLWEDASFGIDLNSIARCPEKALERARYIIDRYHEPVLIEEYICGRELAVSMWGNENVEVLPVSEDDYSLIRDPFKRVLTYDAKWVPESFYFQNIGVRLPAPLSVVDLRAVTAAAVGAFRAVGLRDFGRVDIRLRRHTPYVIDINELPCLSDDSGFPKAARAAGFTYQEMIQRILRLAFQREGLHDLCCRTAG